MLPATGSAARSDHRTFFDTAPPAFLRCCPRGPTSRPGRVMQPNIHLNWLAIVAGVIASFAFGGIWYGPLFGKTWAKAMGFTEGMKPSGKEIARGSALNIIGSLLMAFVLAHEVSVWRPSAWSVATPDAAPS